MKSWTKAVRMWVLGKKEIEFVSIGLPTLNIFMHFFSFTVSDTPESSKFNYYPYFTDKKLEAREIK